MIDLINKFSTSVSENNGSIKVHYNNTIVTGDQIIELSGYCEYRIVEVNNRFKQRAWILINTEMGDVIEFIHKNSPLSDDDLKDVNKLIRDHSLSKVQDLHR
jgi:hypothetical protein